MRRYFIRTLLLINDIITLILSFCLAFYIKNEIFYFIDNNRPGYFEQHAELVLTTVFIYIFFKIYSGTYSLEEKADYMYLFDLIKASFLGFFMTTAFLFASKSGHQYSRVILFSFFVIETILSIINRKITEIILSKIGVGKRKTVILGLSKDIEFFERNFEKKLASSTSITDKYIYHNGKEMLNDLKNIDTGREQIIILAKSISVKRLTKILRYLEGKFYFIKVIPELGEFDFANMNILDYDGNLMLEGRYNLLSPIRMLLKRILDTLAAIILLFLLSPVFFLISMIIKITSPGPIFFAQRRIGRNGKEFKCLKYRTMVINAEEILEKWLRENPEIKEEYEKDFKLKNDPRITGIGNFLRKTSLDELPQLINVIKGDMALVGPRPIVRKEIEKYGEYSETLFRVLPGITGMWQISGRNDIDYKDRIELDMYYIKNWSVWLDLIILLKTIPAVLKRKGAY